MNKIISIIIPVYNEEKYIETTIENVCKSDTCGLHKEIIIIDDASTDKTVEIIERISTNRSQDEKKLQIKLFKQITNQGKGAVIKKGIEQSTGDIVLLQDADLEYSPVDYPRLLDPFINLQADVVYGSRFISDRPHRILYFWHSVGNQFLTLFSNILTNLNLTDMETGYKAFRGSVIREITPKLKSTRFGFEPEITARLARIPEIRIYEVGVSYWGRTYAEGKKIGWRDGIKAIWEIIYFNLIEES